MDRGIRLTLLAATSCALLAACQQDRRGGDPFDFDEQDSGTTADVESQPDTSDARPQPPPEARPLQTADSCADYRDYLVRAWTQEILEARYPVPHGGGYGTTSGPSITTPPREDDARAAQTLSEGEVLHVTADRKLRRFRLDDKSVDRLETKVDFRRALLDDVERRQPGRMLQYEARLVHVATQREFPDRRTLFPAMEHVLTVVSSQRTAADDGHPGPMRQIALPGSQPDSRIADEALFVTTDVYLGDPYAGFPESVSERLVDLIDQSIDGIPGGGSGQGSLNYRQARDRARQAIRTRVDGLVDDLSFPDDLPSYHVLDGATDSRTEPVVDCSDIQLDPTDAGLTGTLVARVDVGSLEVDARLLLTDQKLRRHDGRFIGLATDTDRSETGETRSTVHVVETNDSTVLARRWAAGHHGATNGLSLKDAMALVDIVDGDATHDSNGPGTHRFAALRFGNGPLERHVFLNNWQQPSPAENFGITGGSFWLNGKPGSRNDSSDYNLQSIRLDGEPSGWRSASHKSWSDRQKLLIAPLWDDFVFVRRQTTDGEQQAYLSGTPDDLQASASVEADGQLRRYRIAGWTHSRRHKSAFLPYMSPNTESGGRRDSVAVLRIERGEGRLVDRASVDHRAAVAEACGCEPEQTEVDLQVRPMEDYFVIVGPYGVTAHRYDAKQTLVGGAAYE